ncbi:MAG: hypothetical protein QXW14_03665 [Candidatus Nitrosocaldus sp.]
MAVYSIHNYKGIIEYWLKRIKEARDKIEPIIEEAKKELEEKFKNDTSSNNTTTPIATTTNNKVRILYGDFRSYQRYT